MAHMRDMFAMLYLELANTRAVVLRKCTIYYVSWVPTPHLITLCTRFRATCVRTYVCFVDALLMNDSHAHNIFIAPAMQYVNALAIVHDVR